MKILLSLMMVLVLGLSACAPVEEEEEMHEDDSMMEESMEVMEEAEETAEEVSEGVEKEVTVRGKFVAYDEAAFDEALMNGEDVLLDFYATWCSTCKANSPKIEAAVEGSDVVAFTVDYDDSDELQAEYGITSQSTLVFIPAGEKALFKTLGPALLKQEEVEAFIEVSAELTMEVSGEKDTEPRGKVMAYDASAYQDALANGDDVLLDFSAVWCGTCQANLPKIEAAVAASDVLAFTVNYDDSDELQAEYGIVSQSTLVFIPAGDTAGFKTLGPALLKQEQVAAFIQ
jgi:thiol:disulfide interchange protein